MAYAIGNGLKPSEELVKKWATLLSGAITTKANQVHIPTVSWNQLKPFNDICPMDGTERSVAGCVATAMAIVMKHHEWPVAGRGDKHYVAKARNIEICEQLGATYDWENMLPIYKKKNGIPQWSEAEGSAVAQLIYHCGVTVEMNYTSSSSGAFSDQVAGALINHFSYDKGTYIINRALYSETAWNEILQAEIDADRPLLYSGVTTQQEGHQFVIDGYDSDNYYHVNWGWGGRMNGYFLLTALDPDDQGTGGSSENLGYNTLQDAVIGIQRPQENSRQRYQLYFPNHYNLGLKGISINTDQVESNVPFILYCTNIIDYGNQYFDGHIGYFLVDKSSRIKEQLEVFQIEIEPGTSVVDSEGSSLVIRSEIEEGDRLQVLFSTDNKNWEKVRGGEKTVDEIILREEGAPVAVVNPDQPTPIQLSATVFDTGFYIESGIPIHALQFINTSGQIMKNIPLQGAINTFVEAASLQPGIYILRIQTENGVYHFKVMRR